MPDGLAVTSEQLLAIIRAGAENDAKVAVELGALRSILDTQTPLLAELVRIEGEREKREVEELGILRNRRQASAEAEARLVTAETAERSAWSTWARTQLDRVPIGSIALSLATALAGWLTGHLVHSP